MFLFLTRNSCTNLYALESYCIMPVGDSKIQKSRCKLKKLTFLQSATIREPLGMFLQYPAIQQFHSHLFQPRHISQIFMYPLVQIFQLPMAPERIAVLTSMVRIIKPMSPIQHSPTIVSWQPLFMVLLWTTWCFGILAWEMPAIRVALSS